MSKRQTLEQRIEARYEHKTYKAGSAYQVRKELDRLARQARKLNTYDYKMPQDKWIRQIDVLAILREAKQ